MTDKNNTPRYMRYFRAIQPSEISINKEDIFYRDKYSDIINYFKLMLTNSEDVEVFNYIKPKGMIIISISPGTDIQKYLKIISSNYYLDFLELNYLKVLKSPDSFFEGFNNILKDFTAINSDLESKIKNDNGNQQNKPEVENKRLIMINQTSNYETLFGGKSLLKNFLNYWNHDNQRANFIDNGTIIVWITEDHQEILKNSKELFNVFDLFIKIPILTKIEREAILKSFSEKNPKISFDINTLVSYTENWEVADLNQLLKVAIFKHFLNSDLNDVSNEITDILINTIESGEFLPSINSNMSSRGVSLDTFEEKRILEGLRGNNISIQEDTHDIDNIISQIRGEGHSDFMLSQLYENAASKNYSELLLIIDKLNKKEPIEDNDRKLLAKYAFVLNDTPSRAQINLEKAKKRVDLIKLAFGKEEK